MIPFLMSYPGPTWRIRGGTNFRSKDRPMTNPRRAAAEWLQLADAITAAGGDVLVMPPPNIDPPLTGMIYTANAGQAFADTFLISRMWAPHRQAEADLVQAFIARLGLQVARAGHTWEGQAEVSKLPGDRYILSWGVRSDRESVDEVRARLRGAKTLDIKLRDPFFHGDTCLDAISTPKGPMLLACEAAFADRTLSDLRRFAEGVDVVPVSEADGRAYACNALAIGDQWLVPRGVSDELRGRAAEHGLKVLELDFAELFGKGGGGPRCLVNVMPPLFVPEEVRFPNLRAAIAERIKGYPEEAHAG